MKTLKLPKHDEVTEIDLGGMKVAVVEVTDENRDALVEIAMSMYLGEKCKYCGKQYKTLTDLKGTVFAGYHEHGRLACKACWDSNNP